MHYLYILIKDRIYCNLFLTHIEELEMVEDRMPKTFVPEYERARILSRGGFSTVLKAVNKGLKERDN